jgi:hypothetical protein
MTPHAPLNTAQRDVLRFLAELDEGSGATTAAELGDLTLAQTASLLVQAQAVLGVETTAAAIAKARRLQLI